MGFQGAYDEQRAGGVFFWEGGRGGGLSWWEKSHPPPFSNPLMDNDM